MGKKAGPISGTKNGGGGGGVAPKSKQIQKTPRDKAVAGFVQKKSDKFRDKGKKGPQIKKAMKVANVQARAALASGEVHKAEELRKVEQDARTLYVRFIKTFPSSHEEIKDLHSDIRFVRTPRTASKKKDSGIAFHYAFVEFSTEAECEKAKNKLATSRFQGNELFVDFVGAKSKKQLSKPDPKRLNPTRLFVCGLAPGVTKTALKEMFPKCSSAEIPERSKRKGTSFGFVQFSSPADAKAAFDASQGLSLNGFNITVLFAKITDDKEKIAQNKEKKRKQKEKKTKEKRKLEKENKKSDGGSDSEGESGEEEDEEEPVAKKTKQEKKKVKKEEAAVDEEVGAEEEDSDEYEDVETDEEANNENGNVANDDDDDEDDDDDDEEDGTAGTVEAGEDDDDDDDDDEDDDDDDEGEEVDGGKQGTDNDEDDDDDEDDE